MDIIVIYESIWCSVQVNAIAIMKKIAKNTRLHRFFISYNNIDFYEYVRDQQLCNGSTIVNDTNKYICFMKYSEDGKEADI